jgi:hypothetical protein
MKILNGWQRIGVVMSFIWMIIGGLWAYRDTNITAYNSREVVYSFCKSDTPNPTFEYLVRCRKESDEIYEKVIKNRTENVIIVAFLPLPFLWVFVYLIILMLKWVRNGFNN